MPVYDYRCPSCGQSFEVTRPRSEAGDPAMCPHDGTQGERVWGSVGFITGKTDSSSSDFGGMDDVGGMGGMGDMGHGHSHGPGSHAH